MYKYMNSTDQLCGHSRCSHENLKFAKIAPGADFAMEEFDGRVTLRH